MKTGLVSITFRKLPPADVVRLCRECGLEEIEWGGDVHVPHGDVETAVRVGELTRSAGLRVAAYGSYYRLASADGPNFSDVLASAVALRAPVIRVWAGTRGSAESDEAQRAAVAADALRCADLAASQGIVLAYEFHGNTLTDSTDSCVRLLEATEHPHIKTLWQPPHGEPLDDCLASLRAVLPRLQHLHVFHWWPTPAERLPLSEGEERWAAYVAELRKTGEDFPLLLEFVPGDDPACLSREAGVLSRLCAAS